MYKRQAQAEGTIPDYELRRLDLGTVATCPRNPRRNYGTEEQRTTLGNSLAEKQTTACVAVTRQAYLALWAEDAGLFGPEREYVLLNGERRYRSAQHVGLEALDFVVRDDLAASRADFMDYLLLENEDREDFDLIERARGLQQLLDACEGNAAEVARRRGRDRSWVGNQIALLSLPTEIQDRLCSGEMAERYGRRLARALKENGGLGVAELLDLEERFKEEERAKRETDKALREAAKAGMLSADNIPGVSAAAARMLSADNIGGAAVLAPEPVVLSADNTDEAFVSGWPAPEEVAAMLSADNIPASGERSESAFERTAAAGVLSAGNTVVPHQPSAPEADRPAAAARIVRALGTTAEEQAATLRAGLDTEAFNALLEALYAHM